MLKQKNRQRIIDAGLEIIMKKGYHNTGLNEILNNVGLPKGSFYHYFESKDEFVLAIIKQYSETYNNFYKQALSDTSEQPIKRIINFFKESTKLAKQNKCQGGCLIGNLAQELSDQNERFRISTSEVMKNWEEMIQKCLEEAVLKGELRKNTNTKELSGFILDSWEGANMRMKTERSIEPLQRFIKHIEKFFTSTK